MLLKFNTMKILALKIFVDLLLFFFLFSGLSFIFGGVFTELPKFIPLIWILFILLIFIYQIAYLQEEVFKFKLRELLFWAAIFFFTLISLFLNDRLNLFNQFFSVFIQVFSIYLIIPLLRGTNINQKTLNDIEKRLEFFCWLNVVIVLLNFSFPSVSLFGESYTIEGGSRAFGWMGDQIAIIFSFFISIFLAKQKYIKACIVFIALLATGSIGATFLALIVGIVFFWINFKEKIKSRKSQFSILLLCVFFILFFYFYVLPNATFFNRISTETVNSSEEQGVGFHRLIAFQTALETWSGNKFIGCGFGTYSTIMHKKYDYLENLYDSNISITSMVNAFNQYLQFLVEIGLLGLIISIVFLKGMIKEIKIKISEYKFAKGFYTWSIIFLIFNQTAVWFLPGSIILFIFFFSVALSISYNQENLKG
ncbi:hypothetical protein AR687_00605 [Flavobacteriaceae bacterium CRH]|nr:hypothetical protein AR687_00605 [Flavobacteriaceae bacterium CRH]